MTKINSRRSYEFVFVIQSPERHILMRVLIFRRREDCQFLNKRGASSSLRSAFIAQDTCIAAVALLESRRHVSVQLRVLAVHPHKLTSDGRSHGSGQ